MSDLNLLDKNPITWRQRLARLRGSTIQHDLRPYARHLSEVDHLGTKLRALSNPDLEARGARLLAAARQGAPIPELMPQTFALVREVARRTLGLYPYDVQVLAALALQEGNIVEMQTGEGKTLAAVMPATLCGLTGRGIHILTVNDYLARRDAQWMDPIYRALGLSVGWIEETMSPAERQLAYRADVTYVTAKEAGFDYLRDLQCTHRDDLVHREFHCALADEADSLLIDEARVPLVLAGNAERVTSRAPQLARLVQRLEPEVDFRQEEYHRNVELTEVGIDRVERELDCPNLMAEEHYEVLTELNCALHAHTLLHRNDDYIVRAGRIELVDELTGRVAEDRHWPDGLQAALEAKEGLERQADGQILNSITLEHLLSRYPRLCGMTGTAQSAASELHDLYGLGVVVIPTHQPRVRRDRRDLIFTHREAKERALVEEIHRVHATGRPILVGTASVRESERLADRLEETGVPCRVLNAKNDADEARIIAAAGSLGAVTVSTNMAGRGTDIRLGGEDEANRQTVVELGGLYVLGTNRHESRRIDLQLMGRAGRQGDPGETRFFVSLGDDLLERYGIRQLIPRRWLPPPQDEPIDHPVVRREIDRAQRIVEGQNLEIRRTLWRYAQPIEEQRIKLHEKRGSLLFGRQPELWRQRPERFRQLAEEVGEDIVHRAETTVTLHHIDRAWSEHLAGVAHLREGIHLVGLGGEDPLTSFQVRTAKSFHELRTEIDDAVLAALDRAVVHRGAIDLAELGIKGPSSTWTYIVGDDPFRHQLGRMLTGPGQTTMAIGAAAMAAPLLILWALADKLYRKRRKP